MMFARRRFGGAFATAVAASSYPTTSSALSSVSCFTTAATAALSASSATLSFSPLQQQRRFNASDAQSSSNESGSGGTALDVAMKVNKLKRMHQSGQGQGKKEVERMAWKELNTLSEQQIATAEGKAVALLLNSWAYFARFWEKGKDGPFDASEGAGGKN